MDERVDIDRGSAKFIHARKLCSRALVWRSPQVTWVIQERKCDSVGRRAAFVQMSDCWAAPRHLNMNLFELHGSRVNHRCRAGASLHCSDNIKGSVSGTEMVIQTPASVNSSLVTVCALRIHFLLSTF